MAENISSPQYELTPEEELADFEPDENFWQDWLAWASKNVSLEEATVQYQKECSAKRPYCFSLPERSLKNHSEAPAEWCDECDHFEDCQQAHAHRPKILTLHLKDQYFFDIDQGIKKDEYREATHYWRQRLQGKSFDVIEICRRYPERGDCDNRIWFRFKEIRLVLMEWDNAGLKVKGPTFVISLRGDRLEYPYQAIEQMRRESSAILQ